MLRKSLPVIASLCLFTSVGQAEQNRVCDEAKKIARILKEQYKERPVAFGLQLNGNLLQVYANKETFTVVSSTPSGVSCIVAAGKGWEMLHHIPEGPMT